MIRSIAYVVTIVAFSLTIWMMLAACWLMRANPLKREPWWIRLIP